MRPTVDELEEALEIALPESEQLYMEDSRRLTGPGLMWEKPGAIVEIVAIGVAKDELAAIWQRQACRVLDAVGWGDEQCCSRPHENGFNLAVSAPMDQLYSAIFVAQAAWHYTASEVLETIPLPFEQMIADLQEVMASEARPELIALQKAADQHGVDFISDDDEVSLGHGCGSQTWAVTELPSPDSGRLAEATRYSRGHGHWHQRQVYLCAPGLCSGESCRQSPRCYFNGFCPGG